MRVNNIYSKNLFHYYIANIFVYTKAANRNYGVRPDFWFPQLKIGGQIFYLHVICLISSIFN